MEVADGVDSQSKIQQRRMRRVGLLYDERMCKHSTPDGGPHPENPDRIKVIWNKLQAAAIPQRCVILGAKEAEDKHILSVHSKNHVNLIKNISSKQFDSRRNRVASKFNSIYFNEGSSEAAYLAAGSAIEPELGINKILIVDWDVHHGNGTQKMFWKDPRVLFFSVHRHEFGSFYPATDDGFYTMIGEGPGAGYNINVPWENGRCGDADYFAVWDHILVPVAKEFNPDLIIVSAGFDAAAGDPLGGCRVTPYGYAVMLKKLMDFAHGKIVLALEGGYNLESVANSVLACVEVLLEDDPIHGSSEAYPFESTWSVIQAVRQKLSSFWPSLADELPEKLTNKKAPPAAYILTSSSDSEEEDYEAPNAISKHLEEVLQDVIEPLSKLKINESIQDHAASNSNTWRSELSKVDVWYATFGSNLWLKRFLCYVEGGQVEGMKKPYLGSGDKTPPKEIMWKTFPHRLFFGREFSHTWGPGGVAFLNPKSNIQDKTYMCLYRITLEQFNDVLVQENVASFATSSPLFDLAALNSVTSEEPHSLQVHTELKRCWYGNVVYLGKESNIPILTMTCTQSDMEGFKSGELALCAPAKNYANSIVRGLVEGKQLSQEAAMSYIQEASTKPL
ncbi:PREDICTED: histone deacetylase [Prunus dulcis]|uniref:PREDICTED: histone deacetylase n=1 Tax=Prunus dulcis TaxID=3755 RepID=A0A5E4FI72_PRUDU|nr:histone deacetylase 5 [Prunus dulcis]VVA27615.1 PREDICTED: histone deacetylase [Prunus dulcis]